MPNCPHWPGALNIPGFAASQQLELTLPAFSAVRLYWLQCFEVISKLRLFFLSLYHNINLYLFNLLTRAPALIAVFWGDLKLPIFVFINGLIFIFTSSSVRLHWLQHFEAILKLLLRRNFMILNCSSWTAAPACKFFFSFSNYQFSSVIFLGT